MFEDRVREEGFAIFKKGLVRRLSPTHYVAKTTTTGAWQLVELREGKWVCDCSADMEQCVHLYATQLHRSTFKLRPEQLDKANLKCRYCGSPDVARCGFRYNARGISRRFRCNECQRKFSIAHIQGSFESRPDDITWLFNEVGMLTSKLTDLLFDLNAKLELRYHAGDAEEPNSSKVSP